MSRASWWPLVSHFLAHFFHVKKTENEAILGGDWFLMAVGPAKTLHLSVACSLARQWEFHGTGSRWLGHLFEVLVPKWGIFIPSLWKTKDGIWECTKRAGDWDVLMFCTFTHTLLSSSWGHSRQCCQQWRCHAAAIAAADRQQGTEGTRYLHPAGRKSLGWGGKMIISPSKKYRKFRIIQMGNTSEQALFLVWLKPSGICKLLRLRSARSVGVDLLKTAFWIS